jgi:hypothetical protein
MVFGNGVSRRIFRPKGDEATRHNEEIQKLYSSPNIVRMKTLRRIRCVGLVARKFTGEKIHKEFLSETSKRRGRIV